MPNRNNSSSIGYIYFAGGIAWIMIGIGTCMLLKDVKNTNLLVLFSGLMTTYVGSSLSAHGIIKIIDDLD